MGCVITEIDFAWGPNQYLAVTVRGQCARWAKFEEGTITGELEAQSQAALDFGPGGMIGVGAYVKVETNTAGTYNPNLLIKSYNKKNSKAGFDATAFSAASDAGNKVVSALPDPVRTNRLFKSIWGDNLRVSLDGGVTLLKKITGGNLTLRTGVQLFNEEVTQLHPSEAYQGSREVSVTLNGVVDPDEPGILRKAYDAYDANLMILAGGLDGAVDGGRLLLHVPRITLRRTAPNTPRDGYSTFGTTSMGRADLTVGYKGPLEAFIR